MKFILNENKAKYILNEDTPSNFILNEASDEVTVSVEPDADLQVSIDNGSDWNVRLAAAEKGKSGETTEQVWNDYYKAVWGNNADTIKSLGQGFYEEVTEYGFDENTNPFIKFLKNLGDRVKVYFDTKAAASKYGTLHNAFVKREIAKEELTDENETKSRQSLVYLQNLYEHESFEMAKYFELFNKLRRFLSSEGNEIAVKNINITNNEAITAGETITLKQVFFSDDNTLRELRIIKIVITQITGEDTDKKPVMTNTDVSNFIKIAKDELKGDDLNAFIGFLYTRYATPEVTKAIQAKITAGTKAGSKYKNINDAASKYNGASLQKMLATKTVKELSKFSSVVDNIADIIVGLLKTE